LKSDYRILLILGTTILNTICHQTVIEYASALAGKIKTHEIDVKMNKERQIPSVTLLIVV